MWVQACSACGEDCHKTVWSENSVSSLQACFDLTDWQCFYDACDNINVLTDTISSYITFCVDLVIPTKKVVSTSNKPWVTKELKSVLDNKKGLSSNPARPIEKCFWACSWLVPHSGQEQLKVKITSVWSKRCILCLYESMSSYMQGSGKCGAWAWALNIGVTQKVQARYKSSLFYRCQNLVWHK